jgi:ATP-dependent DNA ligase
MEQCRWVIPKLVCQIAFVEWTDAGHLRHCTFVGMRDDKKYSPPQFRAYRLVSLVAAILCVAAKAG